MSPKQALLMSACLFVTLALFAVVGCEPEAEQPPISESREKAPSLPPEPVVTYRGSDVSEGRVEHGELIIDIDETRRALHAQHHPHGVLETRRIPGSFETPAMTEISDFALSKDDLTVINPGPGEYVHVMEGQRHGYQNLVIGITYTAPGGAPLGLAHSVLGEVLIFQPSTELRLGVDCS